MTCGVYKIVNIVTGQWYVGGSTNIEKRKSQHFSALNRNKHKNYKLQRDYNEYGKENFSFSILVQCNPDELYRVEQLLVDTVNPYYNIFKKDVNSSKGVKRRISTVEKIRKSMRKSMKYRVYKKAKEIGRVFERGEDHPWYWMDKDEIKKIAENSRKNNILKD